MSNAAARAKELADIEFDLDDAKARAQATRNCEGRPARMSLWVERCATLLDMVRAMGVENEKLRADLNEATRDRDTMSALNRTAEEERDAARAEVEKLRRDLTESEIDQQEAEAKVADQDTRIAELHHQRQDALAVVERLKQELISMNEAGADAATLAHGQGQENALETVARELGWGEWPKDGWERLAGLRQRRVAEQANTTGRVALERDALGAQLLDVQQDCIELRRQLSEAMKIVELVRAYQELGCAAAAVLTAPLPPKVEP